MLYYTAQGWGKEIRNIHLIPVLLMKTLGFFQGEVIAMDKIANKVKKIKQNAELLQLNCIKAFCYDGTKALSVEKREDKQGKINNLGSSSF